MDTNQARDSAGTALTQPSFRVDSQGSQTTSSIEDDVAKIIGPMEGGKVTKVDTIFLQQEIDDIKTKERASGFKFQPFKNLKSKFKAKRKRQKEAIDSAKRTLLSDELDLEPRTNMTMSTESSLINHTLPLVTPQHSRQKRRWKVVLWTLSKPSTKHSQTISRKDTTSWWLRRSQTPQPNPQK